MTWHVLDVRAVWIKEFASALAQRVPTLAWHPDISATGILLNSEEEVTLADPSLRVRYFPLQRGFARFPVTLLAREDKRLTRRLLGCSENPARSPLICCSPHYAPVAAQWPGPVVYYVTDLFVAWGENPRRIRALERRMCKAADLVFADSRRIAKHLVANASCPENIIHISPMATRASNLLREPAFDPCDLPEDVLDLPRPVAGVIGNLAANMDWVSIRQAVQLTPWLSWIFVGPTEMPLAEANQNSARCSLMTQGGRVRFVGEKPYAVLRDYARAVNVAVLPYRKREPTYSGSSTRFYEHLAACRPIFATRGFEELLHKEPLLKLVDSADELVVGLDILRKNGFHDGYEEMRWKASHRDTWEVRASSMVKVVDESIVPSKLLNMASGPAC